MAVATAAARTTRRASRSSRASTPFVSVPGCTSATPMTAAVLHHMVYEVVDNSVDEALAGFCDRVGVVIHFDGSVSVEDNGRGIPVGEHPIEKRPTAELVMTQLHAGGKFNHSSYKVFRRPARRRRLGRQCAVGVAEAGDQARREDLLPGVPPRRSGHGAGGDRRVGAERHQGDVQARLRDLQGDRVSFEILTQRLRELSYLNRGLTITIRDERSDKSHEFKFEGGISQFVADLNVSKTPVHDKPIPVLGEVDGTQVDIALQWNDSYQESIYCFTNNIKNKDGGTHLTGFRAALTRTVKRLCPGRGAAQGPQERAWWRRHQRGAHGDRLDQAPRSQVQQPAEGQAGLVRGEGDRRAGGQRKAGPVPRGEPAGRQADHREGRAGRSGARRRPQGARDGGNAKGRSTLRRCPASWPTARSAIRRWRSSTSSRGTAPVAQPSRGATARIRRSCRCAGRS